MEPSPIEVVAAVLFAVAILHTFSTKFFEHLARSQPHHSGLWHLLGEVEVVFGFWSLVLIVVMAFLQGTRTATDYVDSRDFTEPLFVFAIMVIAGTRPILQTSLRAARALSRAVPLPGSTSLYFVTLALVPVLGSFITEPAAMTLAALILAEQFLSRGVSHRFKCTTIGALFVNISIGGTLTHFAAPPVLMVADEWNWTTPFMLSTFGWKATLAVVVNAALAAIYLRRELAALAEKPAEDDSGRVPFALVVTHFVFLVLVVVFAHHPAIFIGLLLFFLGIAHAYQRYQDRLILQEGLLVGFFLAGLVVLGGMQRWWLEPVLLGLSRDAVFLGAVGLTAFTDNAALTYLASLVPNLSDEFKYALVAGAVTGGGLTVIANAPNPAGIAILRDHFDQGGVNPLELAAFAALPTLVAALAFRFL
jgi:predicted cation transporter